MHTACMTHPTLTLDHPVQYGYAPGTSADVDVQMVPLIRTIWAFGLLTGDCCQGGEDYPAYVSFLDSLEASKFARWCTRVHAEDPRQVAVDDWLWTTDPRYGPSVTLRLPNSHVPLLTEWAEAAFWQWAVNCRD